MSESKKTVFVVGLGPGGGQFLTVQAQSALQQAEVLCGYTVYIDLVRPLYPEKECYTTGMTREIDRCRWALDTARAGRDVALVCSGDAGSTAWPARCWSWPKNTRTSMWRSFPA